MKPFAKYSDNLPYCCAYHAQRLWPEWFISGYRTTEPFVPEGFLYAFVFDL